MVNKSMKKLEYIVVWDDCGDPAEAYDNKDEAEDKVHALITIDDVEDYDISVYKGKDMGQIKLCDDPDDDDYEVYADNLKFDNKKKYVIRGDGSRELFATVEYGSGVAEAIGTMLDDNNVDEGDINIYEIVEELNFDQCVRIN